MEIEDFPDPIEVEEEDEVVGPDDLIHALSVKRSRLDVLLVNTAVSDADMLRIAEAVNQTKLGTAFKLYMENVTIPSGVGAEAFLDVMSRRGVLSVVLDNCIFPPVFLGRLLSRQFGDVAMQWVFHIQGCGLTAEDMLMADLDHAYLDQITEISLSGNPLLGDAGVARLLEAYIRAKYHTGKLQSITLNNTGVTSAITPVFARLFSSHASVFTGLKSLTLEGNPMLFVPSDVHRRPVQTMFDPFMKESEYRFTTPEEHHRRNPLLDLGLAYTGLDDEGVYWLARMLNRGNLIFLDIGSNKKVTNSGAWYLWEAITKDGVYTKIGMRGTSVSKAVVNDVETAHVQIIGMYANMRISNAVPMGSGEYKYLEGLINLIKQYHALRKLDIETFLCHVSPQESVDVDRALFFATSCDYGLYFQYKRWTLDDYMHMDWTGRPFASNPVFGSRIDATKINNWDPKVTTKDEDGVVSNRRAPQYVSAVTASLASARHTPVFVHSDVLNFVQKNPFVRLKYDTWEEAFIYSLEKIDGVDGYVSVDAVPAVEFVLPSGVDETEAVHVTEIIVLRPSQLFGDLAVRQVSKEELEKAGRELAPIMAEEAFKQYTERVASLYQDEDTEFGSSVIHYDLPYTMKYEAVPQRGGFF